MQELFITPISTVNYDYNSIKVIIICLLIDFVCIAFGTKEKSMKKYRDRDNFYEEKILLREKKNTNFPNWFLGCLCRFNGQKLGTILKVNGHLPHPEQK